jgi:hypothetical protein
MLRDIEVAEVVERVVANTEVVMRDLLRLITLEKRELDIHVLARDHIPREFHFVRSLEE